MYLFIATGFPPNGSDRYSSGNAENILMYAKGELIHKTIKVIEYNK
jgi:hypothetical protein